MNLADQAPDDRLTAPERRTLGGILGFLAGLAALGPVAALGAAALGAVAALLADGGARRVQVLGPASDFEH